jgi:hypothetical protein
MLHFQPNILSFPCQYLNTHDRHSTIIIMSGASRPTPPDHQVLVPDAIRPYLDVQPLAYLPFESLLPSEIPNARRSRRVANRTRRQLFLFFRLPLEVRNLVYDRIFQGYQFVFGHVNLQGRASYRGLSANTGEERRWPPSCILISKQFCTEATTQFHHMATFVLCQRPWRPWPIPKAAGQLRVDHARIVEVQPPAFRALYLPHTIPGRTEPGFEFWAIEQDEHSRSLFRQQINHLLCSTTLQILDLRFYVDFPEDERFEPELAADGSPWVKAFTVADSITSLTSIRELQEISITIRYKRNWWVPACQGAVLATIIACRSMVGTLVSSPRKWKEEYPQWGTDRRKLEWNCTVSSKSREFRREMR